MAAITDSARIGRHHVDDDVLVRFRAVLESEREARRARVARHEQDVAELTGQSDIDSIVARELADAARALADEAIGDIDDALARIDNGTFGMCESCRAEIPLERLEIIPHARVCVACSRDVGSVLR
jgi:RNA polymerase-binding transcription factor DksA